MLRNEPKLNDYDHFINVTAYQQTSNGITVHRRGVINKRGKRKSRNEAQTSNAYIWEKPLKEKEHWNFFVQKHMLLMKAYIHEK